MDNPDCISPDAKDNDAPDLAPHLAVDSTQKGRISKEERDLIFRLLTEEIRDRHEIGKLEGWTPWLVVGALISMAWILVQDLWPKPLNIDAIRAAF